MGRLVKALAVLATSMVAAGVGWVVFDSRLEHADAASVATLAAVYNTVQTRRARTLVWDQGQTGQPLHVRDAVKTSQNARAVIAYRTGLQLNVDPSSLVVITAPKADEAGRSVQEVLVEAGTVEGEMSGSLAQGGRVRFVDAGGAVRASLVSAASGGRPLRYRVRLDEAGRAEVAVLAGHARIRAGGGEVALSAGQAVRVSKDAGAPKVHDLPRFPRSLAPAVDASLSLDVEPAVKLEWEPVDGAKRYHVQVGRDFALDTPLVDAKTIEPGWRLPIERAGTYYWRVASLDADGREGEFGYVRRFSVLSLPEKAEAPAGEAPEEAPPAAALPEVAQEQEFDLKGRVLGRGLTRQRKGQGPFGPIRGTVRLSAKDVLEATKGAGVRLGRGSVVALDGGSEVVLDRAGSRKGRRVLALKLRKGNVLTDLGGKASLASIYVEVAGARVAVSGEGQGGRARTERAANAVRVVSERGETEVWAKGRRVKVPAGHAVIVPDGGDPSELVPLPESPWIVSPAEDAHFLTLDSPPQIAFEWKPVEGAAGYRVLISEDPEGGAVVYEGSTERTRFGYGALRPGAYWWTVRAVDGRGFESPTSRLRSLAVSKDDVPPQVTLTSPKDGSTVSDAQVSVSGRTEAGAKVKVNGKAVPLDEGGAFRLDVPLAPGLNQIVIEAVDHANNVTFKNLKVRKE